MPDPLQCSRLENPRDGAAWWAAVHGVAKSRARLSDLTFTFHFHALEKEMATHSRFSAWRIPGTGEPGGLRSTGSHRSDLPAAAWCEKVVQFVSFPCICPVFPRPFIVIFRNVYLFGGHKS